MDVKFTDYMVALRSSGLPGPVRSVALWIASRCANSWVVTVKTVAADSGFSVATVKRGISVLEADGWLVRMSDPAGNRYRVTIPEGGNAGSERANGYGQSEPRVGSERANGYGQSEPTYTRTEQEQTKTNLTPAPAREAVVPSRPIRPAYRAWSVADALLATGDSAVLTVAGGDRESAKGRLYALLTGTPSDFQKVHPLLEKHQIGVNHG